MPEGTTLHLIHAGGDCECPSRAIALLEGPAGADLAQLGEQFRAELGLDALMQAAIAADTAQSSLSDEEMKLLRRYSRPGRETPEAPAEVAELERRYREDYDHRQEAKREAHRALQARFEEVPGFLREGQQPGGRFFDGSAAERAFAAWLLGRGWREVPARWSEVKLLEPALPEQADDEQEPGSREVPEHFGTEVREVPKW